MKTPAERRVLRESDDLNSELADHLLTFEEDFRTARLDRSLARVVQFASQEAVIEHAHAIAAGSAASELWRRLSNDLELVTRVARQIVEQASAPAPRTTITLLVLDPLDTLGLGSETQVSIAGAALASRDHAARGLAVEYLSDAEPERVLPHLSRLAHDADERVRGYAWRAAFRADGNQAWGLATNLLGDESADLATRRSALVAAGQHLTTADVEDLLAFFVMHPNAELAIDAAEMFHRYHRTPVIANAALQSPHDEVQEIARRLMDPYRGSPAAGGSRPGNPTTGDAYANLLRQLGSEPGETDPDEKP